VGWIRFINCVRVRHFGKEFFIFIFTGVLLLHSISLHDSNYQQHHSQVSVHYNPLIQSLAHIYKERKDLPRAEGKTHIKKE
jgi:hypothetical protein